MEPRSELSNDETEHDELAIGVFSDHTDASRVAASLRSNELNVRKVSLQDRTAANSIPEVIFEDVEEVDSTSVASGAALGGLIGAGSGLLFLGIPGLNIAAPIAGGLVGSWIGGIAGIDETTRAIEMPGAADFRQMLVDGKSFVVVMGNESTRLAYTEKLKSLGAVEVHNYPPLGHAVKR